MKKQNKKEMSEYERQSLIQQKKSNYIQIIALIIHMLLVILQIIIANYRA